MYHKMLSSRERVSLKLMAKEGTEINPNKLGRVHCMYRVNILQYVKLPVTKWKTLMEIFWYLSVYMHYTQLKACFKLHISWTTLPSFDLHNIPKTSSFNLLTIFKQSTKRNSKKAKLENFLKASYLNLVPILRNQMWRNRRNGIFICD